LKRRKRPEDALSNILRNEKVYKFIEDKKEELRKVFAALADAFWLLFPNESLKLEIIGPLIWDVIKYEPCILNVYVLHDFGLENWGYYGGKNIVSLRIVEEIFQLLDIDVGDIKVKSETINTQS
jgi:hypothetical protein